MIVPEQRLGDGLIIGSGIDVVEISRIARVLARRGERFERRVFRASEITACRASRRPALAYARLFAAKEATMKALGTGWARGISWTDIEVAGRSPRLELRGRAGRVVQPNEARVALAHSDEHAFAWVVLEERERAA